MAVGTLLDATIAVGATEVRSRSNKVSIAPEVDAADVTTFGSGGARERIGSLGDWSAAVEGFADYSAPVAGATVLDLAQFSAVGTVVPVTIAVGSADGSVAYVGETLEAMLEQFEEVGAVAPFALDLQGSGRLARGMILHPAGTARTATGTGTARQLGTVATGRQLVAACHVYAVAGTTPSLTVTLQRDDNGGMSSPTTVGTFGPFTAPGASLLRVDGPITPDDRYRVTWTISGTGPSFLFTVAAGITY